MRYKLRKDKLVSEDNIRYIAYGIDVYKGWKKVRSIKDVSLDKKKLRRFVKQCKTLELQHMDNAVLMFVEDEFKTTEKPYFLK